ncbi:Putative BEN domain-containing protein B1 [Frankliniella fusca]|uniref:BEN domain-containing protein B1 n=1 Tax=Frankliniella fusca TaxID=407009 RepID=A0AAE1HG68_9NEOP|nr:Putative BEN domain-containing protein B1 [Frankliniella fusca]
MTAVADGTVVSDEDHFIIYVKRDDSFNLVPKSDVICDESSVKVNDTVQLKYKVNGRRELFVGSVKEISRNLTFLEDRLKALNKSRPKSSPQPGNERRTRRARSEQMNSKEPHVRKKMKSTGKENRRPRKRILSPSVDSEDDPPTEGMCTDVSDSDSGPELTEADLAEARKLAKERKRQDLDKLSVMAKSPSFATDDEQPLSMWKHCVDGSSNFNVQHPLSSPNRLVSLRVDREHPSSDSKKPTSPVRMRIISNSESGRSLSVSCDSDSDQEAPLKQVVRLPRTKRPRYEKRQFEGEYFKCHKEDEGVVQLHPGYEIYIKEEHLRNIKRDSKTGPMMARLLLKAIYSEEACKECSPTGRPSGPQKFLRPPLHPDGIHATHGAINKRATKRHWPTISLTNVKKAFSDVLCEDRYAARLLAQQQA